jgi:EAL domain-containing protein (putative c-di-GMP-specific phosphodiesterase class I)
MSLVRNIDGDPLRQKLVASIASLSRSLGILVVSEGIETEAERDAVVGTGCDLLQGYLFGRPAALAMP